MFYYKLKVLDIPETGRDLEATSKTDEWLDKVLKESLSDQIKSFDARLNARLSKSGKSVDITGGIYLELDLPCGRCLKDMKKEEQISFRFILEPAPKRGPQIDDDEEDVNDQLDFSYYHGDEVDIGDLIRQHVLTNQPISYICSEECKGLCQKCGIDLNEKECSCVTSHDDSPFSVLKQLKH